MTVHEAPLQITVAHSFLPKTPTSRAIRVMDHFGIGFKQGRHMLTEGLILPLKPGEIVLFTGESGSGKSSLLRETARQLSERGERVVNVDELALDSRILVDLLPIPLDEALPLLTSCGLGEAQLLLRTPEELSDGQRARFRLALALAAKPNWVLIDEFTATLDRRLAKVIAFNLRRLADRNSTGFLCATTHEDIADDLGADVKVVCRLDGRIEVHRPDNVFTGDSKKKCCHSPATYGSLQPPSGTGRTSLGGIIAATSSD